MSTVLKVLDEINKHGFKAYIVGGYVRDFILGIHSSDIDICTDATPKDIKDIFNNVELPRDNYSAVRLYIKNYTFDIMTFRKEISYYNNRKPMEIEYIKDLKEDLLRRDFTMNSLCMDKDGNIIDLLNAKEDILNKTIRVIGDPDTKFKEDPLRILRAIRFYTTLDFNFSDGVIDSIKNNKQELSRLSLIRKKEELDRIFISPNSKKGVKLLIDLGVDKELKLDFSNCHLNSDLIGVWASIGIYDDYPFTKNERNIIKRIKELCDKDVLSPINLYEYGLYISSIVGDLKGISRKKITEKYEKLPIKTRTDIDINAEQIIEVLNIEPSKKISIIYDDLINKILCDKLENNYNEIVKYIVSNYK